MGRLIPGFGYLEGSASQRLTPGVGYIDLPAAPPSTAGRRALVMSMSGTIMELTDAMMGLDFKPLVFFNGRIQERASFEEGVPLVLINGVLHTLAPGDSLMI